jgi:hypothetical protein
LRHSSRELKTCVEEHLNEKSMEKIAGLQVQFETDKKEREGEKYDILFNFEDESACIL